MLSCEADLQSNLLQLLSRSKKQNENASVLKRNGQSFQRANAKVFWMKGDGIWQEYTN